MYIMVRTSLLRAVYHNRVQSVMYAVNAVQQKLKIKTNNDFENKHMIDIILYWNCLIGTE
jgi:hypothetical protein